MYSVCATCLAGVRFAMEGSPSTNLLKVKSTFTPYSIYIVSIVYTLDQSVRLKYFNATDWSAGYVIRTGYTIRNRYAIRIGYLVTGKKLFAGFACVKIRNSVLPPLGTAHTSGGCDVPSCG